jgi:hypothetical protein
MECDFYRIASEKIFISIQIPILPVCETVDERFPDPAR